MNFKQKLLTGIFTFIALLIVFCIIFFCFIPSGRALWLKYDETMKRVDDDFSYETQKEVENTCRAMISSYNADKLTYEQYKNYEIGTEQRNWADAAKLRANQTASTYNNYILKNSYVWRNNIPSDIYMTLQYLE